MNLLSQRGCQKLKLILLLFHIEITFHVEALVNHISLNSSAYDYQVKSNIVTESVSRIIIDVTGTMTHKSEIDWKSKSRTGYMEANDNLFRCACLDNPNNHQEDFDCKKYYGNVSLSFMFPMENLSIAKQFQMQPISWADCSSALTNYENLGLGTEMIFSLIEPQRFFSDCFSIEPSLSNLISHFKSRKSAEKHKITALGLEYNKKLVRCFAKYEESGTVFDLVDFVVFRLEFSSSNYESLFVEFIEFVNKFLKSGVFYHRDIIHKINPQCKIYIRLLTPNAKIDEDGNLFRFRAVLVAYLSSWLGKNKGSEIFIIEDYPSRFKFDLNTKQIIPELKINTEIYNNKQMRCTNKFVITTALSEFKGILLRNLKSALVVNEALLSNCQLDRNEYMSTTHRANLSVIITPNDARDNELSTIITTITKDAVLNLEEIYFSVSPNASVEHWTSSFKLLRNKRIEIGCHMKFFSTSLEGGNHIVANFTEQAEPFCGNITKILIEIEIDDFESKILQHFNDARNIFKIKYPGKILIPKFNLDLAIAITRQHQSLLRASMNDVPSVYCDSLESDINNVLKFIRTRAYIFGWKILHLGNVILDEENESAWWRNIAHGNLQIQTKEMDFPVLVRTNDPIVYESEMQLPMTYKCINYNEQSRENAIPFLGNKLSGCTIDTNVKLTADLTPLELKTMLLFAFGKFSTVELVIRNEKELSVISDVMQDQTFLKIFRSPNKTSIYMEVPIAYILKAKYLDRLSSDDVSLHFNGWNYYNSYSINSVLKKIEKIHNQSVRTGLTVDDCEHEIYSNLTNLTSFPLISQTSYIVCDTKPVIPINSNQTWMAEYLNTMFYMKNFLEAVLPTHVSMKQDFKVYFRLNLVPDSKLCRQSKEQKSKYFLGFLNDVNQHSLSFNIKYFLVKGFEYQNVNTNCSQSWWRLTSYNDLSNSTVYIDKEEEYFGRPTKQLLQLPPPQSYIRDYIEESQSFTIAVVVSVVSVILLVAVIILWFSWKRMRSRYLSEKEINDFYNGNSESFTDNSGNNWLGMDFPKNYEVSRSNIQIIRMIGSGEFGKVFVGILLKEQLEVAIKEPRQNERKEVFKNMLMEVKILCFLSKEQNINVVQFMGACTREIAQGKLLILMEHCKNGSLQDHLRILQARPNDKAVEGVIDFYELYKFAHEIASGMYFISSKNVVHGDLSTRNVLLDVNFTCKIADFGLSRKLYKYTEYIKKSEEPMPWRWMALESLKNMEFTTKSDVWSYGVTLWEIFSLGSLPYPGLSWSTDFVNELENGMRMGIAQFASEEIHETMLNCWCINKDERPNFSEMVDYFLNLGREQYTVV